MYHPETILLSSVSPFPSECTTQALVFELRECCDFPHPEFVPGTLLGDCYTPEQDAASLSIQNTVAWNVEQAPFPASFLRLTAGLLI